MSSPDPDFGGLSGLEVDASGTMAEVITDRGFFYILELERTSIGELDGVTTKSKQDLNRESGGEHYLDTEGLARSRDGALHVSVEGPARVGELVPGAPGLSLLPRAPQDKIKSGNKGFEALATDVEGTLFTIPEAPQKGERYHTVYAYASGTWDIRFTLPQIGTFEVVGADFGPDGKLYVLERAFSPLGFRSRIVRVDPEVHPVQPDTLITTPLGKYDNLEGLSVWQTSDGQIRLTAVSDNNFLAIQEQQIVEFALQE